ncbi:DinB family protein [Kribbella sp. WER1]
MNVAGLTEEQAFARPVHPSALTPGGIVKHLTGVERFWFAIDFAGLDVEWPWSEDDPHGWFPIEPGDTVAGLLAAYRTECARSREIVAGASFDERARSEGMEFTLRYAVAHLIEETARHLGQLDLLRESTDGLVGE